MSYHVLIFCLGRRVESHPFSWEVSPACHAQGVLDRDADEAVIVPCSGGIQVPPTVPSDEEAARARAELGPMERLNQVPLIFWIGQKHSGTASDRAAELSALVEDACRRDRVVLDGEAVAHADDFSNRTMTARTRDAVAEARDRDKAADILEYAAEHDWFPECSFGSAYEQYLFHDALNAIEELPELDVSVPHEHLAAAQDLQRRVDQADSGQSAPDHF